MNVLIIEDEKHNADRLERLLLELSEDINILASLSSVEESLKWLNANPAPDAALMDIRLSDGLSFEIIQKAKQKFPVIFTTAYDEYAIHAFKVNSIDYLLKPIKKEELEEALKKIKSKHLYQDVMPLKLLTELKEKIYRKRILLTVFDGFKTITVDDINFVYSENKSTRIVLNNNKEEIVDYTLDNLEEEFDPVYFFRANRQFIVHVNSIEKITNSFNGKLKVELKEHKNKEVLISKEKATKFKEWLDK